MANAILKLNHTVVQGWKITVLKFNPTLVQGCVDVLCMYEHTNLPTLT